MAKRSIRALFAWALLMLSVALPAYAQDEHLQYFGYFANNGYVSANYNHTNITEVGVWTSDPTQATSAIMTELAADKQYGVQAMVQVSPFLFTTAPGDACPYTNLSTSSQTFATFVNQLISAGYLVPNNPAASTVVAFYPADEPDDCGLGDANGVANPALVNAINTIRTNPNTRNFPIAAIFGENYRAAANGILLYDWVGWDDYALKDANYISAFQQFESYTNKSTQKTILVPQAAEGGPLDDTPDTPSTMFSAAQSDPQVVMLLPFLWANSSVTGTSQIPSLLSAYTGIGQQIKYGHVPPPPPTYTAAYLSTTFTTLDTYVPSCSESNPYPNTSVGTCLSAIHRFCENQGYTAGGFPEENAGNIAVVSCVTSTGAALLSVNISSLTAYQSGCTMNSLVSGPCASAISDYCEAKGYGAGGFGPMEYQGSTVELTCMSSTDGNLLTTTFTALAAKQPTCTSTSWTSSSPCMSAVNRVCSASGYLTGYGIAFHSGNTAIIGCMRANVPNTSG